MAFCNCPIELFKIRLQVNQSAQYKGLLDCALKTIRSDGMRGMYRGILPTIMRDVPSFAAYFGTYEAIKSVSFSSGEVSSLHMLLAGGLAGVAAWLPCYPQDVIKSRMQASHTTASTAHEIQKLYRTAGWKSFFRGFAPTIARSFPANAVTFFAYELVQRHFQAV